MGCSISNSCKDDGVGGEIDKGDITDSEVGVKDWMDLMDWKFPGGVKYKVA